MFQCFSSMARSGLRALLASSAALGLTLGLAPGALAAAPAPAPAANRPAIAPAVAGPVCTTVQGYLADLGGRLYRTADAQPLTGTSTLTHGAAIGRGWTSDDFAWVGSGGGGVVYGITWTGLLKWFKYDSGTSSWGAGGGTVVGSGFTPGKSMINIGLGEGGRFYVVRPNGDLYEYEHTGWATGARTWGSPRGDKVGTGWTDEEILVPVGDGSLYRQVAGKLLWYRHTDPASGPVTWTRRTVGTGFRFYDIRSAGGGVLYATSARDGSVRMFAHLDPTGGTASWANPLGLLKGEIDDPDSHGLSVDPDSCSAPV